MAQMFQHLRARWRRFKLDALTRTRQVLRVRLEAGQRIAAATIVPVDVDRSAIALDGVAPDIHYWLGTDGSTVHVERRGDTSQTETVKLELRKFY